MFIYFCSKSNYKSTGLFLRDTTYMAIQVPHIVGVVLHIDSLSADSNEVLHSWLTCSPWRLKERWKTVVINVFWDKEYMHISIYICLMICVIPFYLQWYWHVSWSRLWSPPAPGVAALIVDRAPTAPTDHTAVTPVLTDHIALHTDHTGQPRSHSHSQTVRVPSSMCW